MKNNNKNYIWNLIYSMVNAAQSMILLLLVNRFINEDAAGIFSYGFSVAVLFMYIGNFGIRNFQVSDSNEKYSFAEYCGFRFLTSLIMIVSVIVFLFFKRPSSEKMYVLIFLCLERLVEAIEDVFHGRFQQKDDLFLAGFLGTLRFVISDIAFMISLYLSKELAFSCFIYFVVNAIVFIFSILVSMKNYGGFSFSIKLKPMLGLFLDGISIFIGYFLLTYLTNVNKYSLEKYYSNSFQAKFNMIFMPVLVINLLSTVIFRPIIVLLADLYNKNEISQYRKNVFKQEFYIFLIAIIILPICYFIGIPVLEWFYNSELSEYRLYFMILMIGGVFSAISSFLNVCIITIRKQNILTISLMIVTIISYYVTEYYVKKCGIAGASYSYLIVMILQALCYLAIHEICVIKYSKNKKGKCLNK